MDSHDEESGPEPRSEKETSPESPPLPVRQEAQFYQGLMPHPDIIRGFEQVLPGSAERIMSMAEQQMSHRHHQEKRQLEEQVRLRDKELDLLHEKGKFDSRLGAWIIGGLVTVGLILGLAIIGLAGFLIYQNRTFEGLGTLATGLAALVWGGFYALSRLSKAADELDPTDEVPLSEE